MCGGNGTFSPRGDFRHAVMDVTRLGSIVATERRMEREPVSRSRLSPKLRIAFLLTVVIIYMDASRNAIMSSTPSGSLIQCPPSAYSR